MTKVSPSASSEGRRSPSHGLFKNGIIRFIKLVVPARCSLSGLAQFSQGTWKKGDSKSQFEFLDANGNKLALNPGQTWITLVADPGAVKYTP